MDILKLETDTICSDAAIMFRRYEKLRREMREVENLIDQKRKEYMFKMSIYGMCRNKFEQACKARGFML